MPARVPWRLVGVIAAVLLLTLVTIGVVRACAAPRALTSAQYDKLMKSGTLAGIATTSRSIRAGPRSASNSSGSLTSTSAAAPTGRTPPPTCSGSPAACRPTRTRRPSPASTPSSGTTPARPRPRHPMGRLPPGLPRGQQGLQLPAQGRRQGRPGRGHLAVRGEHRPPQPLQDPDASGPTSSRPSSCRTPPARLAQRPHREFAADIAKYSAQ